MACAGSPAPAAANPIAAASPTAGTAGEAPAEAPAEDAGKVSQAPASAPLPASPPAKEKESPKKASEALAASADAEKSESKAGGGAGAKALAGAAPVSGAAPAPSQSGLKAGYSDDNEQFNYFVKFLDQYKSVPHYELAIGERIVIKVFDPQGRSVANADVEVKIGGKTAEAGRTYSDGSFYLYPLELGNASAAEYAVEARVKGQSASVKVSRGGPRTVSIVVGAPRAVPAPLPVDVLFVLDTTGSMGEEIERLRATIEIISANITSLSPRPALRFGMVLYRDRDSDEEYDTKIVPFTSDLGEFQKALDDVSASGGGDDPEDLQSALRDAVGAMKWNADGIRLGFIITDAQPHLDYGQDFTYAKSARAAKAKGIKLFSIGAGGLPLEGEYPLRQIAQYTQGKYIFLTYGEKGEAEGGKEGSVSHHTGSNFATDKLEAIVIKFVREEIARQSDRPLETDEAYSDALKVSDESRELTLSKLFAQTLQDLSDYSSIRLPPEAKVAVMPLAAAEGSGEGTAAQAEYFGSQLNLAASKVKLFKVVERGNLQAILSELELQMSGLADESAAAKAGKVLGADYLVTGTVFQGKERYELFLKLVRVETAEVLAATKARVDLKLGL
jgi:TolB-like protein